MVEAALQQSGMALSDFDAIAATAGPGLIGGVMVGLTTAKALAIASGKPLIAINHLEAHALTVRLSQGIEFPFLLLLVSGGHCQLLAVERPGRYVQYGTTIDDAIGEAFDKTARLLGLAYPGGPKIEALAVLGDSTRYALPRPLRGRPDANFSFSGLKTAVRQVVQTQNFVVEDLAASFQAAATDCLVDRTGRAMERFRSEYCREGGWRLVVAGGVAANGFIRKSLANLAESYGFDCAIAPVGLCTDNAAMVAWAGIERASLNLFDPLSAAARPRWPLDPAGARAAQLQEAES